jgi:hypothetical protein
MGKLKEYIIPIIMIIVLWAIIVAGLYFVRFSAESIIIESILGVFSAIVAYDYIVFLKNNKNS